MKKQLLNLNYLRKKERNSLVLVISILLLTSFVDEIYFFLKNKLTEKETSEQRASKDFENEVLADTSSNTNQAKNNAESFEQSANSITPKALNNEKDTGKLRAGESKSSSIDNHKQVRADNSTTMTQHNDAYRSASKPLESIPIKQKLESIVIDPNNPNVEDLEKLGIKGHVARTWAKYTDSGGTFDNLEDLEKIYGIDKEQVASISQNLKFKKEIKAKFNRRLSSIYVNQATANEFAKIPGIGPVLSERIVKFRDKLGGFHSISQFSDVYGIEPELIERNKSILIIDDQVSKININTCDEKELGNHSYCSYRTAKTIVNYRRQHGNFTKAADLLEIRIVDSMWLEKIAPYLDY